MVKARIFIDKTYRSNCQEIENLSAVLPGVGVTVFLLALVVEAVHLGNLSRLVVSTQKGDLIGPASLQRQEVGEGLQGVVTAINKVSHKNVVRVGQRASSLEQLAQIVELTMDVSANSDR